MAGMFRRELSAELRSQRMKRRPSAPSSASAVEGAVITEKPLRTGSPRRPADPLKSSVTKASAETAPEGRRIALVALGLGLLSTVGQRTRRQTAYDHWSSAPRSNGDERRDRSPGGRQSACPFLCLGCRANTRGLRQSRSSDRCRRYQVLLGKRRGSRRCRAARLRRRLSDGRRSRRTTHDGMRRLGFVARRPEHFDE
jgi:hypothetical protein